MLENGGQGETEKNSRRYELHHLSQKQDKFLVFMPESLWHILCHFIGQRDFCVCNKHNKTPRARGPRVWWACVRAEIVAGNQADHDLKFAHVLAGPTVEQQGEMARSGGRTLATLEPEQVVTLWWWFCSFSEWVMLWGLGHGQACCPPLFSSCPPELSASPVCSGVPWLLSFSEFYFPFCLSWAEA